jgi:hypothetical protein
MKKAGVVTAVIGEKYRQTVGGGNPYQCGFAGGETSYRISGIKHHQRRKQ